MKHNELLNSLRKGDQAVLEKFADKPELLNALIHIAQHPIPWKSSMAGELRNANGAINQASTGFQYVIQTTTLIAADVIYQRFYEEAIADFADVLVGRGPWMGSITQNVVYDAGGPAEQGFQDVATKTAIDNVEVALAPINVPNVPWIKGATWSILELQQALASNNWDLQESKLKALARQWQIGVVQTMGFIGRKGKLASFPGLLSNTQPTVNNSFIPTALGSMTSDQLDSVVAGLIGLFRSNANETCFPTRFTVPMSDWTGLGRNVSIAGTPISQTRLEYLEKAFQGVCGKDFKILATAYGNKARNAGYWASGGTNRYVLYRKDPETLHMDIPVDMTIAAPGTSDNVRFNQAAYGQVSGMNIFRVPEVMYFDAADSL